MIEKIITYVDYNGTTRTESFFFNLNQSELTEMNISKQGGLREHLDKIIKAREGRVIMDAFKEFILKSYGEKSEDGRRFIKSEELSQAFTQTEAYNKLFMELVTDAKAGADFINGILPEIPADVVSPAQVALLDNASKG